VDYIGINDPRSHWLYPALYNTHSRPCFLPNRGTVSVVILMLYYVIPLSTMVQIVRQHDASSIYLPLAIAAALNGGMWTIYGLVRPLGVFLEPHSLSAYPSVLTAISLKVIY